MRRGWQRLAKEEVDRTERNLPVLISEPNAGDRNRAKSLLKSSSSGTQTEVHNQLAVARVRGIYHQLVGPNHAFGAGFPWETTLADHKSLVDLVERAKAGIVFG